MKKLIILLFIPLVFGCGSDAVKKLGLSNQEYILKSDEAYEV